MLRTAEFLPQVRQKVRPLGGMVCALVVLECPDVLHSRKQPQVARAGVHLRRSFERARQAYLAVSPFTKVSPRDQAALANENPDTVSNCLEPLLCVRHIRTPQMRDVNDDPRNLQPTPLGDGQDGLVYPGVLQAAELSGSLTRRQCRPKCKLVLIAASSAGRG